MTTTNDAPLPPLSDAELEGWIDYLAGQRLRDMGGHTAEMHKRRAAFLRDALALRKRLDNPHVIESAAGDGPGSPFSDCVDLILLYRQYLLRAEGPDAALRAAVMGEE